MLGRKIYTHSDQIAFAEFSHDWNPLHMDAVRARRLVSGGQVVHGVNILLTALEFLAARDLAPKSMIRVRGEFKLPVNLNEEVSFTLESISTTQVIVNAYLGSVICTRMVLTSSREPGIAPAVPHEAVREARIAAGDVAPVVLSESQYLGYAATLAWTEINLPAVNALYPQLVRSRGATFCHAFGMLSYVVGMVCPGLNSVFVSLDVAVAPDDEGSAQTGFHVSKFEDRIKLLELTVDQGPLLGTIRAFHRPPPVGQPAIGKVREFTREGEFAPLDSYVIGGSRGLGELVGKIIAAGGGRVTLGYAVGQEDAAAVCEEINATLPGSCAIDRFNVMNAELQEKAASLSTHNAVFYFATPVISKKVNTVFDPEVFRRFVDFYVHSFHSLCIALEKHATKRIDVFYPSTVFIEERPNGMTEYAMAKSAAEIMINDMNRSFNHVRIHVTRLPRLRSDQTNSFFPAKTEDNLEHMLKVVRAIAVS